VSENKKSAAVLNERMLASLPRRIGTPQYDRRAVRPAIVHFGVGGFHRAHQAVYTDDVLAAGDLSWGIRGAGITEADVAMKAALSQQDFLYTVVARDPEAEDLRVVGSIGDLILGAREPKALVAAMADVATRIISMTITENGYCYRADTGDLDIDNPAVRSDISGANGFRTIYGCLRAALNEVRRKDGIPPTIMSCDNLPQNGDRLKRLFLQYLEQVDHDLRRYVSDEVSFPNCMVDRITPATTADDRAYLLQSTTISDQWPVFCERFRQWVIEDRFTKGHPDWSIAGATFVPDVVPFERMKIRLLNGSHSALGYVSYLMGFRRVDLAMADPDIRVFVRSYMDEISPTVGIVPGINLGQYKDSLIKRFSNPAIADQVLRLAQDGSKKIPNMILEPVSEMLESGTLFPKAAFAIAAWIRFLEGVDESGEVIPIDDPLGKVLQEAALATRSGDIRPFLAVNAVFPQHVARSDALSEAIASSLASIRNLGMRGALRAYRSMDPSAR